MNTHRYKLCLTGLHENRGQIKASSLRRVLDALIKTAERATRLLVTGEGIGRVPKRKWLDSTVDLTITGLESGSTVLDIEAPYLGETANEEFTQQVFWREPVRPDDTALDLAAFAIKEAGAVNSPGNRFDGAVLEAILKFRRAAGNSGVRYELVPQGSARGYFALDEYVCGRVNERLKSMMAPKAFVVSGRLDEIRYGGSGRFRLWLTEGRHLPGRLHPDFLDVEALRSLWGKRITVEGMVHFKANGHPRLIRARRVSRFAEGDGYFEEMPSMEISEAQGLTQTQERQARSANFMELWGSWPGDEPIDELLAQLD